MNPVFSLLPFTVLTSFPRLTMMVWQIRRFPAVLRCPHPFLHLSCRYVKVALEKDGIVEPLFKTHLIRNSRSPVWEDPTTVDTHDDSHVVWLYVFISLAARFSGADE